MICVVISDYAHLLFDINQDGPERITFWSFLSWGKISYENQLVWNNWYLEYSKCRFWYNGHDFNIGKKFKLCPLCLLPLIEIFICNFTTFSCRHHVAVGIFFLCRNSSFQIQITFKLFLIMHDKDSKHFVLLLQQRQKRIAWHDKLSKVFI